MAKDQIESGELFRLSTGGNLLSIIVGSSEFKSKQKPMKQISFQTIIAGTVHGSGTVWTKNQETVFITTTKSWK